MSKYDPLSERLAGRSGPEWRVSFAELEKVLGSPLPKAARIGAAWWRNDAATPQARAWTESGWAAGDVDQAKGWVTFRKPAGAPKATGPKATGDEPAILKRLDASPGWGMALIAGGVAVVVGLGALAVRGVMRKKT